MSLSLNRSFLPRAFAVVAAIVICIAIGWGLVQHSKLPLVPVILGGGFAAILVFAELGLTALWLWPPLGVLAYPLTNHLPGGKYVSFDRIWVVGMVVLLVSQPKVRAHARASRRMMLAFALLAAVIGLRSVITPAPTLYAVRTWFDSLVIPLILFAIVRRTVGIDGRLAERVAFSVMVAGALLALIGIAEHILGFSLATYEGSQVRLEESIGQVRISGPYDAPETYGLALVMCLAATMYWLLSRPRVGAARFVGVGVVALELIAIFFTFFRVGWISALFVVVAALGLRPNRYGRAVVAVAVAALVLVPLFLELETIPAVQQRVANTQNIYTRLAVYEQGWQIFESAPVFGVGAQRYSDVAMALPITYVNDAPSQPYPHSSLFEVMAEDGVVGLIALVAAFWGVLGLVRALNRAAVSKAEAILAAALAAAAVSYLIYSLTLTMLPYSPSNEMFAILLGLGAGRLDYMQGSQRRTAARDRSAQPTTVIGQAPTIGEVTGPEHLNSQG